MGCICSKEDPLQDAFMYQPTLDTTGFVVETHPISLKRSIVSPMYYAQYIDKS